MSIKTNNINFIIENPKPGYYPHNNEAYYTDNQKYCNKKYAVGMWKTIESKNIYYCVRKGYWVFYNKGNNIIEFGNYADNGKKFGFWCGYFGGKKDMKDRLKYETNYIDDKFVGIQKFYLKTKDKKTVYLWKEIEFDELGNFTGNFRKYNESKNIIWKTFIVDNNIIIKEKYDSNGNILVHREYTLKGKPINTWFVNSCKPKNRSYIVKFLTEHYKKDFESKYKDDKTKIDDWINYLNHPYHQLNSYHYKTIPECISEISYIKTYTNQTTNIEIYDKNNNLICIVEQKNIVLYKN